MRLPWLEVASMVPLPVMANDVGEDIIEVEAFLDASSFTYSRVILDAYHFFHFIFILMKSPFYHIHHEFYFPYRI